ncbi:hypothetical protein [Actinocrispum wychmicini]|uniref:Uncharacterized protein n=1 Tax=Actinocrispum wychmicini TaxID=1213861 RepID=A0A4R2J8C9_9PSEU|nr:hypothetical protein [Actinocrispum wychmicini]TCO52896.1 hypothetical protein EV192_11190 [Actinocrispum wychmicini]
MGGRTCRGPVDPPRGPGVVPEVRHIWVQRDGFVEYKTWFIFSWEITGRALDKLSAFLTTEKLRFRDNQVTPERLRLAATDYSSLTTELPELPPRLAVVPASRLASMGTRLVTDGRVTYGDSVGGLSPSATGDVDAGLRQRIGPRDEVLFSPGVLARLRCELPGGPGYLFQLAVKNLRKTGSIFYKAVGGHLKFHPAFDDVIGDLDLRVKRTGQVQDTRDLVFRVRGDRFPDVIDLFEHEVLGTGDEGLFVAPVKSMYEELWEEVGPTETSDGVSLFSDLEMRSDFVSTR